MKDSPALRRQRDKRIDLKCERIEKAVDFSEGLSHIGLGTSGDGSLLDLPGCSTASTVVLKNGKKLQECFVHYGVGGIFIGDYLHAPDRPGDTLRCPKYFIAYSALEGVYQTGDWKSQLGEI